MESFPEDQYRNKRTIELNAGGKLDGYMIMPGQDDLHYFKAGWLMPLDDFIKDPSLTDASWDPKDFFASFTKAATVEGKQIGVVINTETSLLSYRKDLFEQFKMKVPTTMKELEETAKFFHGKEVDGKKLVGITLRGKGAAATSQWVDFLYSFGGSWTTPQGKANLASPQDIEATAYYGEPPAQLRPRRRRHAPLGREHGHLHGRQGRHALRRQRLQVQVRGPQGVQGGGQGRLRRDPGRPGRQRAPRLQLEPVHQQERRAQAPEGRLAVRAVGHQQGERPGRTAGRRAVGPAVLLELGRIQGRRQEPRLDRQHLKSFEMGNPQWNPPVINVPEIRDIVGQVIVDAIQGKNVAESAKKGQRTHGQEDGTLDQGSALDPPGAQARPPGEDPRNMLSGRVAGGASLPEGG